jgi:hypothetical protein
MMLSITRKAGLSFRYTNHSLRATPVHILDSTGNFSKIYNDSYRTQIYTSLKTYKGYTASNIKRSMADTLSKSLRSDATGLT